MATEASGAGVAGGRYARAVTGSSVGRDCFSSRTAIASAARDITRRAGVGGKGCGQKLRAAIAAIKTGAWSLRIRVFVSYGANLGADRDGPV